MVLALRHGLLPRTLHVDAPSPHVDWSAGAVALLTEPTAWPDNGHPRRAGVSSFGISGTNAHVILEAATPAEPDGGGSMAGAPAEVSGWAVPLVISGRDEAGLCAQAARLLEFVAADSDLAVADVGRSLATRSMFGHRAVVVGADRAELLAGLGCLARGEPAGNVVQGVAGAGGGPVFVFPGQGSQWVGMGVALLDGVPVFAARMPGRGASTPAVISTCVSSTAVTSISTRTRRR